MKIWFEILSDLFVNLSAGWFAVVFIEPQLTGFALEKVVVLTLRLIAGIVSLTLAKRFREEARKR